jgi:hypothetical protein
VSVEAALCAEALRVNARYVEEVVIGWGLCPWAAQAWRAGAVTRRVLPAPTPDPTAGLAFIDEITAQPATAIGLLIFPRVALDEAAWGGFAERVRRADRARRPPGAAPPFLLAAFHPAIHPGGSAAEAASPAALVSYLRRTPDPMLQLVRANLLEGLREGGRDVSGEIARANFTAVGVRAPAALDAVVGDIRHDRDAAYARL